MFLECNKKLLNILTYSDRISAPVDGSDSGWNMPSLSDPVILILLYHNIIHSNTVTVICWIQFHDFNADHITQCNHSSDCFCLFSFLTFFCTTIFMSKLVPLLTSKGIRVFHSTVVSHCVRYRPKRLDHVSVSDWIGASRIKTSIIEVSLSPRK